MAEKTNINETWTADSLCNKNDVLTYDELWNITYLLGAIQTILEDRQYKEEGVSYDQTWQITAILDGVIDTLNKRQGTPDVLAEYHAA